MGVFLALAVNRSGLKEAQTIVVKVGTSSLTYATGRLNLKNMERIVRQIADLHNSGKKVVLVSSGAVGAGVGELGLTSKPRTFRNDKRWPPSDKVF